MQIDAPPATSPLETTIQEVLRDPPESLARALEARGHTPDELEAYVREAESPDRQEALRQLMLRAASSTTPEDSRLAAHLQGLLDPRERSWNRIIKAFESGETLSAMVVEAVKGGLVVDLGVRGFIPASHAGLGTKVNLQGMVGRTLPLKVIEVNRRRQMVVLSHRKILEEDRTSRRKETLQTLKAGEVREGIVRRLSEIGAFVDVGGVDGLLHISEISWNPVQNVGDVLKVGQKVQVLVQRVDAGAGRISLSMRRLTDDPWIELRKRFQIGKTIPAKVKEIISAGVVVELDGDQEALIPMRELSDRRVNRAEEVVQLGQQVEVVILEVRERDRRLIVSIREAHEQRERKDYQSFNRRQQQQSRDDGRTTLGDLFGHLFADQLEAARDAEAAEKAAASASAAPVADAPAPETPAVQDAAPEPVAAAEPVAAPEPLEPAEPVAAEPADLVAAEAEEIAEAAGPPEIAEAPTPEPQSEAPELADSAPATGADEPVATVDETVATEPVAAADEPAVLGEPVAEDTVAAGADEAPVEEPVAIGEAETPAHEAAVTEDSAPSAAGEKAA